MERSITRVKIIIVLPLPIAKCWMLVFNHFKYKKLNLLDRERILPKTKKWPCETTYQKFHPIILILGILSFPSTFWIGSRVSTMIPFVHSKLVQKLAFIDFRWAFQAMSSYHNGLKSISRTQDQEQGCKLANVSWRQRYDPSRLDPLPCP
jgi:hypothetical protein